VADSLLLWLLAQQASIPAEITALQAAIAEPSWLPMTLASSWSNRGSGDVAAQYRPWTAWNMLEVIGTVSHASVSGTSVFCAGLGYAPSSNQHGQAMEIVLSGLPNVQLYFTSAGTLEFAGLPSGSTIVAFHWFFSLDA
jgi:hypothetical protein